jgi:hypothetical protein
MAETDLSLKMVERAEHALQAVRFAVETGNRDDLREAQYRGLEPAPHRQRGAGVRP